MNRDLPAAELAVADTGAAKRFSEAWKQIKGKVKP